MSKKRYVEHSDLEEYDEDEDLDSKLPPLPGHREHHCTDACWLMVLLLGLAGQVYLMTYAAKRGDTRKLTRGFDYLGNLCGVDVEGKNLFWCQRSTNGIGMHHPICVHHCPEAGNHTHPCFDSSAMEVMEQPDYDTQWVFHYCLPKRMKSLAEVMQTEIGTTGNGTMPYVLGAAAKIKHAWLPLVIAANIAIITGYMYLLLLDRCALLLVYLCEATVVAGSFGVGGYLIYLSRVGGTDQLPDSGDANTDLMAGLICIAIGSIMICVVCCANRSMTTALGCIEATCECMFQEPSLLLEPFAALTTKVLTLGFFLPGLAQLITTGEVSNGGSTTGFSREFAWTGRQRLYITGYVGMLWWILEICHALSQYVLAWTTQMWYFTPYVQGNKEGLKNCGFFRGYANALRFHMGTLAIGALLCGSMRIFRYAAGLLAKFADSERNPLSPFVGRCCFCMIHCYKNLLECLTKGAYMDVAITSSNYCTSAGRALEVLTSEVPAVASLNGAQLVFHISGLAIISFASGFLTLLMVTSLSFFRDTESPYYVQDPKLIAGASAVVGGLIGVNFMLVFDTVGDTILYCFATEQMRHRDVDHETYGQKAEEDTSYFGWMFGSAPKPGKEQRRVDYAPERLRELIDQHSEDA